VLGFDLTPLALADLKEIGRYTEDRWGRLQRDRYLNQLDGAFRKIATNPSLGRKRDDLRAGYRSCVRNQHVVFYRIR
jgi:toxin ParE1/3/4